MRKFLVNLVEKINTLHRVHQLFLGVTLGVVVGTVVRCFLYIH